MCGWLISDVYHHCDRAHRIRVGAFRSLGNTGRYRGLYFLVFYSYMSMSDINIPNFISREKLEALSEEAPREAAPNLREMFSGDNAVDSAVMRQAMIEATAEKMDELDDIFKDPMMMKLAIKYAANALFTWHMKTSEAIAETGQHDVAAGWSRDAGILQSIDVLINGIDCGQNDWIAE